MALPNTSNSEEILLRWDAVEFVKHPKGTWWFILAGITVFSLVMYAFWTNSWTMAIAFIILAGVYTITHHKEPGIIDVKVTRLGIQAGKKKIPYNQIKAFWIVYNPPSVKVLKLLTTDKFMGEVSIQLDGQDPGSLREYLLRQIPEFEGKGESFADLVIRLFKL
ncbi:MAG: hypothetical protein ACD_28C00287G0005 [uncultured bacterium]|nr:MAG: hypothetical protein ACD_28C00287G0005 [uncultured bacterium]KKT74203.1 MAG: hypothetical protein UW70_C0063G0002 [Candidatus Peregrinibacteria bacterium GW2011_GWA2_44_7]